MTRDRFRAPGVIVPDIDEVEWDDEADIICVGTGSAALAVAVAADADGLDVLLADGRGEGDTATLAGRLGLTGESAEYLDCVTEDTGPLAHATSTAELTVRRKGDGLREVVPARDEIDRRSNDPACSELRVESSVRGESSDDEVLVAVTTRGGRLDTTLSWRGRWRREWRRRRRLGCWARRDGRWRRRSTPSTPSTAASSGT